MRAARLCAACGHLFLVRPQVPKQRFCPAAACQRELSAKVFAGQCRLIELRFRQGGPAGFGLRRVLVDEHALMKEQYKIVEQTYGQDVLNLALAKGYLVKLLECEPVLIYLQQHQPELVREFELIRDVVSLE